jgi:hypothetical protein
MSSIEAVSPSSLLAPKVATLLEQLHRDARADLLRILRVAPLVVPDFFGLRKVDDDRLSRHMRATYLPGLALSGADALPHGACGDARRIVEFGTSFGISTLYLAAAVKDNGGGVVVGSELDASKHAKAREHLREAGLDGAHRHQARGRAADAGERRRADRHGVARWLEGLVLAVLKLLQPKLKPRAIVLADNIFRFKRALRTYVEYVQSGTNGFVSSTLEIADGFELSVFTGEPVRE